MTSTQQPPPSPHTHTHIKTRSSPGIYYKATSLLRINYSRRLNLCCLSYLSVLPFFYIYIQVQVNVIRADVFLYLSVTGNAHCTSEVHLYTYILKVMVHSYTKGRKAYVRT